MHPKHVPPSRARHSICYSNAADSNGSSLQHHPGDALRRGEIDLLVTALLREAPAPFVVAAELGTEECVLAVAPDHPLAERPVVSLEDLADYEAVAPSLLPDDRQEAWVPFNTASGRPIVRSPLRPESFEELSLVVARGYAVHPAPSLGVQLAPPNVLLPIKDLPPIRIVLPALPGERNPRAHSCRAHA